MSHIILIYYILALMTGFAGLTFAVLVLMKYKNRMLVTYLVLDGMMTLMLLVHFYQFYWFGILPFEYTPSLILVDILYFLIFTVISYTAPLLTHQILSKPFTVLHQIIFGGISFLGLVFLAAGFSLFPDGSARTEFIKRSFLFYSMLVLSILVYIEAMILLSIRKLDNEDLRKILGTVVILIAFYIPGGIADASWQKLQIDWKILPRSFNIFGAFYFLWNLFSIIYGATYFFLKPFQTEPLDIRDIKITAEFAKQFQISDREAEIVQMMIEGKSNGEIGNKMYIAPGTVKNHISKIYQKTQAKNRIELINLVRKTSGEASNIFKQA